MSSSEHWREMFTTADQKSHSAVGHRLGVPFTRTLAEFVTIKVTTIGYQAIEKNIYQDGSGMIGISGVVWDCGLYMIDFLQSRCHDYLTIFPSSSILDIGCGTGICGIAALLLGARQVCFSDHVLTDSLDANLDSLDEMLKPRSVTVKYSWSDYDNVPEVMKSHFDFVLCSDCLYDVKCHDHLLKTLQQLSFTKLIIAYKKRHDEHELLFFEQLSTWCDINVKTKDLNPADNLPANLVDDTLFILECRLKDTVESRR
jgi:predicted nicotinamide N-methyase